MLVSMLNIIRFIFLILIFSHCSDDNYPTVENILYAVEKNDQRKLQSWKISSDSLKVDSILSLITASSSPQNISFQNFNKGNNILNNDFTISSFNEFESKDKITQRELINNLIKSCASSSKDGNYKRANANINLAMHLLVKHNLINLFKSTHLRVKKETLLLNINETTKYEQNIRAGLKEVAEAFFKLGLYEESFRTYSDIIHKSDSIEFNYIEKLLNQNFTQQNLKAQAYYYFQTASYYDDTAFNYKKAYDYYTKTSDLLKESQETNSLCELFYFKSHYYSIYALIGLEEYEKAIIKYKKDILLDECTIQMQYESEHIKMLTLEECSQYMFPIKSKLDLDFLLDKYIAHRNIFPIVMNNQSETHLDAAYTDNTEHILNALYYYYESNPLPNEYKNIVENMISTTKTMEYKRKNSTRIEKDILFQVNEAVTEENWKNQIFKEAFNFFNFEINQNNSIDRYNNKIKVKTKNSQLEILQTESYYWFVSRTGDIRIQRMPLGLIQYKMEYIINSIIQKEINDTTNKYITTIDSLLSPFKNISLVSLDGGFHNFPLSILPEYSKHNHVYKIDIDENHKEKTLIDEVGVFSYSDKKTLNSDEPIDYYELQNGYEECKFIKDSIFKNAKFFAGTEMNASNFDLNNLNIAHISTHALSEPNSYYDNSLLLRIDNNTDKIYGFEFLGRKMPEFVFLNACETAKGKFSLGAGNFSINRYILQAGTETTIKTLWSIDDGSSAYFARSFYKEWIKGISVHEAFHLAQQQTKAEFPEPYHWAPFVLEGNPNLYLSQN
jgi:hypothetical protein